MWCDWLGWLLDCTTDQMARSAPHGAPEIDGGALGLALVLVVGVLLVGRGR